MILEDYDPFGMGVNATRTPVTVESLLQEIIGAVIVVVIIVVILLILKVIWNLCASFRKNFK